MLRKLLLGAAVMIAAAGCVAQDNAPKPKFNEFYYQRASLFDALGVDSTSIVFFGNSLTNGCEWHELLHNANVVNRGISGDIVEGLENRLACVTDGKPAKIFLMVGANDVSHDLSADSIATAITQLVDHIQAASPSTKLYLQSMLPINNSFGRYKLMAGKEETIRQINALIEPMAAEKGITFINLYPSFCDEEGNLRREFTNDGLHLLAPAYLVWRDIVRPYVEE